MRFCLSLFACLAALLSAAPSAMAAKQDFVFTLDQSFSYDSNPRMITRGEKALHQSSTTPGFAFASKTPTSALEAKASVTQNIANLDGYKTTDGHGSVSVSTDSMDWHAGLKAQGDYDTTHTGELTTLGYDVKAERRTAFAVSPEIAFKPSALDRIGLTPSYTKTVYDGTSYTDYHTLAATLDYLRQFTPKHSGFIAAQIRRYQADEGLERRVDSVSPTIGFISALTPVLKARVSAGAQSARESLQGGFKGDWEWSQVYDASLTFAGEQHTAALLFSRQQQPYVNGNEELLTSLRISDAFKMTERATLRFSGAFYWGKAESGTDNLDNRWEAAPGFSYRLLQSLDMTGGYRYRSEKLYDRTERAQSHMARVGVVWKP